MPRVLATTLLTCLAAAAVLGCKPGPGGEDSTGAAPLFQLEPEREVPAPSVEGPDLFLGRGAVDFGPVWQGAVREVVFPLTSNGTEPLRIKAMKAGCGCTLASAMVVDEAGRRELVIDEPLAPGTRVEVTVVYDSRGRTGPESKAVTVYHDGPTGRARLEVGVEVQPFLVLEPAILAFGRTFVDGRIELEAEVHAATGEPFALSSRFPRGPEPGVELSATPSSGQLDGDGRSTRWRLVASLDLAGLQGPGGILANPDPNALGGQNLIASAQLITDLPLPAAGPVPEDTPRTHFLDTAVTATLLAPIQASTSYLSFGSLAPGAATSSSVRIECFAPDLVEGFRSTEPAISVLDATSAPGDEAPDWAKHFTPTLRLVTPENAGGRPLTAGALAAWDLEVLGIGFRGGDKNRVSGRIHVDFPDQNLADQAIAFQAILQP
ncbi:MAG: DUF1573 domain-containing protein [Planctomycetota bacterium]|nr:DUF1573 domain-containing protein [Planctomycetota bacterium]